MSVFEHSRWRIFNPAQHPLIHDASNFAYSNSALPGVSTLVEAFDYITAFMYPKYIGTYANMAAALVANPTPSANDYIVVSDDGDGKSAGYVWQIIENTGAWQKRYDVDWTMEAILGETTNRTQYMYVHKFGMADADAAGVALTGINSGQHIYGGTAAGSHLTLHANSANADTTGYIQAADNVRPQVTNTFTLGAPTFIWSVGYFGDIRTATMTTTGTVTVGGNVNVTGTISASNFSGSNTGDVTLAAIGSSPNANAASLSGQVLTLQPASASFGGVVTTGTQTFAGAKTFSGDASFTGAGTGLAVTNDATVGGNLGVTGTVTGSNLSGTNTGNVTLAAFGSTPATEGASLSGQVLTLQPADATHGGGVSTTTQTFAGAKTFTGAGSFTAAGTGLAVTNNQTIGGTLIVTGNTTLTTNLLNGSDTYVVSELMTLKSTNYRDAGRTSPVQTGDTIFWSGTQWLASAPDTEITHGNLSGLTTGDAGHTQFVMLAGRSGGQAIQGGTAASENLTLESTAHATKGSIKFKDNAIPNTNASFSSTWSGTDLGDATHFWRDVYTRGEFKNFRLENLTSGTLPSSSGSNIGRLFWTTDTHKVYLDNGSTLQVLGSSGGGGGGSITWNDNGPNAPVQAFENSQVVYLFESGLAQTLTCVIKVPTGYSAGDPISMKVGLYSPSASNTILLSTVATLVRSGTDAVTSTTNQRTSTNAALTNASANRAREAVFDLTSTTGTINSVAVAAGDLIFVTLTRGSDSDTADIRFLPYAVEMTFSS